MNSLNSAEIQQTKLLANAFDRASTACFTVGIATPLAGYGYSIAAFSTVSAAQLISGLTGWLFSAVGLHYVARLTLRRLG